MGHGLPTSSRWFAPTMAPQSNDNRVMAVTQARCAEVNQAFQDAVCGAVGQPYAAVEPEVLVLFHARLLLLAAAEVA